MTQPLGLTLGDPAGIGPEICARLLARTDLPERPLVLGDPLVLARAAEQAGLSLRIDTLETPAQAPEPGSVGVIAAGPEAAAVAIGQVSRRAGEAAYAAIHCGIDLCLSGWLSGLVTAPIHKEAFAAAEVPYLGHTEMLADLSGESDVAMMLANRDIRTVLTSIHVPLSRAVEMVTREAVLRTIRHAHRGARALGVATPRVAVAGLNPHAGEGGLFGDEDAREIAPAIDAARREGIDASGPWPGDTVFMAARTGEFDIVVAQYHDQGLIPVKYLGLADGVNVTLGLPFIRTSPDHGTAFNIAGKGMADPASLLAAFRMALQLRDQGVD
ncbi:MAG: 4-hydroxythreonine-4-phosphate dehydrogenase PdxA [Rhodospirillaceae bacterium]|nr:MAG: 4-hydroxythreonine-4-phosphate dehydrogenase PdxA [Rhodospirillaceae bacterium]